MKGDTDSGRRLAEVVAAIALASDLALGQPLDHAVCLRRWRKRSPQPLKLDLGERFGAAIWRKIYFVSAN